MNIDVNKTTTSGQELTYTDHASQSGLQSKKTFTVFVWHFIVFILLIIIPYLYLSLDLVEKPHTILNHLIFPAIPTAFIFAMFVSLGTCKRPVKAFIFLIVSLLFLNFLGLLFVSIVGEGGIGVAMWGVFELFVFPPVIILSCLIIYFERRFIRNLSSSVIIGIPLFILAIALFGFWRIYSAHEIITKSCGYNSSGLVSVSNTDCLLKQALKEQSILLCAGSPQCEKEFIIATSGTNVNYCKKLGRDNYYGLRECMIRVAAKTNDDSICGKLGNPTGCIADFAKASQNYELCGASDEGPIRCVQEIAVMKNDINKCLTLPLKFGDYSVMNTFGQYQCILAIAKKNHDISMCQSNLSVDTKNQCYFQFAIDSLDFNNCKILLDLQRRNYCLDLVARYKRDVNICLEIDNISDQNSCIKTYNK